MDKFTKITEFDIGTERPTIEYVESLEKRSDWLSCLEYAGVDNWQGYEFAYEMQKEYFPERYED